MMSRQEGGRIRIREGESSATFWGQVMDSPLGECDVILDYDNRKKESTGFKESCNVDNKIGDSLKKKH